MENTNGRNIHWSFWLIGIFMLIWNVLGSINFIVQMIPGMVSSYRETEQVIIHGRPLWATMAFAVAVFGGAFGCIFLLLKNKFSSYFFIGSLLGVVVTMIHTLGTDIKLSIGEIIGIVLMPLVVATFLVWYSKYTARKGWIR